MRDDSTNFGTATYSLALLTVVGSINVLDRNIFSILIQPIKQELHLSDTQLGFLSGMAFATFYAIGGIPIGAYADRGSRRRLIVLSLLCFSVMTALCGVARSFLQLALARIGVAIGEAGIYPAAHSIITDAYPRVRRALAMSIFSLSVNIGLFAGLFGGGLLSQHIGWRGTFAAVCLPGVLAAALVFFTLREPSRGQSDGLNASAAEGPPLGAVIGLFWKHRSLRHILIGYVLAVIAGTATSVWLPALFGRAFAMPVATIGVTLAITQGLVGGIGTIGGGWLIGRMGDRDPRWTARLIALFLALSTPFTVAVLLAPSAPAALGLLVPAALLTATYYGPSIALIHTLVPPAARARASAILFFSINLFGWGVGPQLVGWLSDKLTAAHGADSLRYALLVGPVAMLWSACHYLVAAHALPSAFDTSGASSLSAGTLSVEREA
ncbi:MAG: MFS transporter [Sphingomonadaceae bacterium]|nr:MFS transporter [Sphingomonadaceae bacterium]